MDACVQDDDGRLKVVELYRLRARHKKCGIMLTFFKELYGNIVLKELMKSRKRKRV